MKVLHIITGLRTGGAETMLAKIVSAPGRSEHSVVSLSGIGPIGRRIAAAGVPVHALNLPNPWLGARSLVAIQRRFRSERPDIVQGWMYHGNLAATFLRAMSSGPVSWNVRQSLRVPDYDKWMTRKIIRLNARFSGRADTIIYNSVAGAEDHEAVGFRPDKRKVIPNGFDLERFRPSAESRARVRADLGVAEDAILVGLVARHDRCKNHRAFFEAASAVLDVHPQVRFLFVGSGMSTANRELVSAIADPRVVEASIFLGERQDIPELTGALDVACNVSLAEAFANSIGEAMACSVPCLVTDVGDSRWIVGDAGVVLERETPSAIASGLLGMIEAGQAARRELGARGRRRVEEMFSIKAVVEQYDRLYEALV